MGKRYHCEYCNRSFADPLHTRKKHINGVQHKTNRKLHSRVRFNTVVLCSKLTERVSFGTLINVKKGVICADVKWSIYFRKYSFDSTINVL